MLSSPRRRKGAATALLLYVGSFGILLLGCDTDNIGKPAGPYPHQPVYPVHQDYAHWSRQGLIAYQDKGIVCVESSGCFLADTSLAGVWIIDPSSGEKYRVTSFGITPRWSPEGERLAFVGNAQIFTVDLVGGQVHQLTHQGRNFSPAWSPDGTRIAFDSDVNNLHGGKLIWIMQSDGSQKTDISEHGTGEWRAPCWSPDGASILHERSIAGTLGPEIYAMDVSGSNPVRLTENQQPERHPKYSPDGNRIAFTRQHEGQPFKVWTMKADGSEQRQLTTAGGYHPSWSPDGSEIVYSRHNSREYLPENGVLWIINVKTGEERQLTHHWPEQCP